MTTDREAELRAVAAEMRDVADDDDERYEREAKARAERLAHQHAATWGVENGAPANFPWTPELRAEAKRLYLEEDKSATRVAQALSLPNYPLTREAVAGVLYRAGVKKFPNAERKPIRKKGGKYAYG